MLERNQSVTRDDVQALQARVVELEGKVAALSKRVGSQKAAASRVEDRLGSGEPGREQVETPMPSPSPRAAAPVPAPTAMPELDLDGLRREASRQLPGGYQRGLDLLRDGSYEAAIQAMRAARGA